MVETTQLNTMKTATNLRHFFIVLKRVHRIACIAFTCNWAAAMYLKAFNYYKRISCGTNNFPATMSFIVIQSVWNVNENVIELLTKVRYT